MADLRVNIGNLALKNPVMTASGTFGYGEEFADLVDIDLSNDFICEAVRSGSACFRMANAPVTIGAAMDVPLLYP